MVCAGASSIQLLHIASTLAPPFLLVVLVLSNFVLLFYTYAPLRWLKTTMTNPVSPIVEVEKLGVMGRSRCASIAANEERGSVNLTQNRNDEALTVSLVHARDTAVHQQRHLLGGGHQEQQDLFGA